MLYIFAAVAILYCQDSVYRLSAVISTALATITLHQVCGSVKKTAHEPPEETPEEAELRSKVQKIREDLFAESMSEANEPTTESTES